MSVLLITVVMLGLAGAFFVAHKSDLSLMTSGIQREQTKNACLSLADFVQYKLQNDRRFGQGDFSRDGRSPAPDAFPSASTTPFLEARYISERRRGIWHNMIRGSMADTGVEFEIELINNLDGTGWASTTNGRSTPPRTARAWITANRGSVIQHIDFVLKRSPFTNASITSGSNIEVQLTDTNDGNWWLGARQPSGNAVRASGTITGPEVWSETGRAVLFTPPPGMETLLDPPYGVLQGEHLNMQIDGVPTDLVAGDEQVMQAEENIRGVLSPGGGNVLVPELNSDDLQGAAVKVPMPNSELVFKTVDGPSGPVHLLIGDGRTLARYDPTADRGMENRWFSYEDGPAAGAMVIDLESRVMAVKENIELQTSSGFALRSETSSGDLDTTRQPILYLGSAYQGSAIDASSIDIEGSVGGMGALKSSDGDLKIAAKSYLSTTPDFGIALHSSEDIVLTRPGLSANDGLAVDWSAYAKGYRAGTNGTLEQWATLDQSRRNSAAAEFKDRKLAEAGAGSDFEELWAGLTAELPANERALEARDLWLRPGRDPVYGPDPDWQPGTDVDPGGTTDAGGTDGGGTDVPPTIELEPGIPAGPGISIDKYVRLREYLRTVKSGSPDESWLSDDNSQRGADVVNLVENQLSTYQLSAGQVSRESGGQVILEWKPLSQYFQGGNPFLASYTPDMTFRGLIYAGGDFIFDTERKGIYIEGALVAKGDVRIANATGAHFVYNAELLENLFATDEEDTSVPLERSYWAYY